MKPSWTQLLARVDALSLRERVMLFASVTFVMLALADALVWSPARAQRKSLTTELATQAKEIATLQMQVAEASATAPADSPRGQLLAQLARARTELQSTDQQIHDQLGGGKHLASLPDLMDQVLRRHERLTLTHLLTTREPPSEHADAALRWQSVDLGVSGSYLDLVQYLGDLEHALPELRWGPMQINTKQMPPELTVRLFLAGDPR